LIRAASEYIEQQGDADLIIFHSTVRGFYELVGFESMDEMVTLIGDPSHPRRSNDIGFMRFVSEKGQQGREQFAKGTLYFGDDTW
jgi:hypothetical protein